jgi:hypothetical protein
MAALTNLKLLADFFNKIGHLRPIDDVCVMSASLNSRHGDDGF